MTNFLLCFKPYGATTHLKSLKEMISIVGTHYRRSKNRVKIYFIKAGPLKRSHQLTTVAKASPDVTDKHSQSDR